MIVPDDKNWTWVIDQPCVDCGFDASTCNPVDVASLVMGNATTWEQLASSGGIRSGRPNDATWSSLEYACHVRDVYRLYKVRIAAMLAEEDPQFANWDQDVTATNDAYEQQDPEIVIAELVAAAQEVVVQLDGVSINDWQRTGRRSDGASFTVDSISRYMVHDPIHHVWDVMQQHP